MVFSFKILELQAQAPGPRELSKVTAPETRQIFWDVTSHILPLIYLNQGFRKGIASITH